MHKKTQNNLLYILNMNVADLVLQVTIHKRMLLLEELLSITIDGFIIYASVTKSEHFQVGIDLEYAFSLLYSLITT